MVIPGTSLVLATGNPLMGLLLRPHDTNEVSRRSQLRFGTATPQPLPGQVGVRLADLDAEPIPPEPFSDRPDRSGTKERIEDDSRPGRRHAITTRLQRSRLAEYLPTRRVAADMAVLIDSACRPPLTQDKGLAGFGIPWGRACGADPRRTGRQDRRFNQPLGKRGEVSALKCAVGNDRRRRGSCRQAERREAGSA